MTGYEVPAQDAMGRERVLRVSLSEDRRSLVFVTPSPASVAVVALAQVDRLISVERMLRDEAFSGDQQ